MTHHAFGGLEDAEDAADLRTQRDTAISRIAVLEGQLAEALKFIDELNCDGCEYEDGCPSNARHYVCRPCQASRAAAWIRAMPDKAATAARIAESKKDEQT